MDAIQGSLSHCWLYAVYIAIHCRR